MDPFKFDRFGNKYSLARLLKPIHAVHVGTMAAGTLFYALTHRPPERHEGRGMVQATYLEGYTMALDLGVTQVWVEEFELVNS